MKYYFLHFITDCRQQVCQILQAFKCNRSSAVLLAPLNEEDITAVASYRLGIFSQTCSKICSEPLIQLPGVALGSGCRILHPQLSAKCFLS